MRPLPSSFALLLLSVACERAHPAHDAEPVLPRSLPTEAPPAAPPVREKSDIASERAEWLRAAEGLVADPGPLSNRDSASHAVLEKLLSSRAWLSIDPSQDFGQALTEFQRCAGLLSQLLVPLTQKGATDDSLSVALYSVRVTRPVLEAAARFLDGFPAADPTYEVRQDALEGMRANAGIALVGALAIAREASPALRSSALTELADAAYYRALSPESLQLIGVTLDEQLLPTAQPDVRKSLQALRAVVAQTAASMPNRLTKKHTTYQAVDLGKAGALSPLVSKTGKFSVELPPGALAKQVRLTLPDGTTRVEHSIQIFEGASRFEAICHDGQSAAAMAAAVQQAPSAKPDASPNPGKWITLNDGALLARSRVLQIGSRGCVATVQAPIDQFPKARAEAFLTSLRAAR